MSHPIPPEGTANPYASLPPIPGNGATAVLRPTGVSVVAVLCILFGILGVLSGLMQAGQLVFAQKFATAFVPSGEEGNAQREWFGEMQAINTKYIIPNAVSVAATTGLSICLLVGGIGLVKPTLWSRTWIRRTLLAAIIIETLRQVLYGVLQFELQPVMARQFEVMAPGGPSGTPEMFKTLQTAMMFIGYAFAILWFLLKLAGYIWGRSYLNRDTVKGYIDQATRN